MVSVADRAVGAPRAPKAANRAAVTAPIPEPDPVTSTTQPVIDQPGAVSAVVMVRPFECGSPAPLAFQA